VWTDKNCGKLVHHGVWTLQNIFVWENLESGIV